MLSAGMEIGQSPYRERSTLSLESYLDFLEEIGAFDSKKLRAKPYREVFTL